MKSNSRIHEAMTTAEMAEVLRRYYIEDATRRQSEAVSRLKGAAAERCFIKTRLFKLALVLITLRRNEKEDARLSEVVSGLEKLTYLSANEGVPFAVALDAAIADIRQLISLTQNRQHQGQDRTPTWARDWLAEIGIEENNVFRSATFALSWLDEVLLASDIVDECKRKLVARVFESNSDDVCTVHGTAMHLTKIPLAYGLPPRDEELWNARAKLFPNSKRYLIGGCTVGAIGAETEDWVCEECRKAERHWRLKNGHWE